MEQIGLESVLVDKGFQAGLAKMDNATKHTTSVLGTLGNVMTTAVGTAIGFLTAQAIPKLVDGLGDFIKSAAEAEKIEKGLDAVLLATAGSAGVTKEAAIDLANGFSKLTTFEDDSIVAAESVLLRFKEINKDVFPRATELTLDLATALGMDASNAAKLLGKALEDPTQGIGRLRVAGVNLTDQQEKMVKAMVASGDTAGAQKLIMDELAQSIGGAAKVAGQTAEGQWKIFQNQLGNIGETIGGAFLPILTELTRSINKDVIPTFQAWADKYMPAIASALQTFGAWITTNWPMIQRTITDAWSFIRPTLEAFSTWLKSDGVQALQTFFDKVKEFQPIVDQWKQLMSDMLSVTQTTTTQMNADFAFKFPSMTDIVKGAMDQFKTIMETGLNYVKDLQLVITAAMRGDWVAFFDNLIILFLDVWKTTLPGIVSEAARNLGKIIAENIYDPVNAAIRAINDLIDAINRLAKLKIPTLPTIPTTPNSGWGNGPRDVWQSNVPMQNTGASSYATSYNTVNNFNLTTNSLASAASMASDFGILRSLAGL